MLDAKRDCYRETALFLFADQRFDNILITFIQRSYYFCYQIIIMFYFIAFVALIPANWEK